MLLIFLLSILTIFVSVNKITAATPDDFSMDKVEAEVKLPDIKASMSIGFNYDFLYDPLSVSTKYARGFFGMNLPFGKSVNLAGLEPFKSAIDSLYNQQSFLSDKESFRPTVGGRQYSNSTVRVEVPMLGGVASFSSIKNFYVEYINQLGNPYLSFGSDSIGEGVSFLLRGTMFVPVSMNASWETMTFGYVYDINKYIRLGLSLHRHVFMVDMRGKIDADLIGRYNIETGNSEAIGFGMPSISGELDYPSSKIYGRAYGHYETEVWSPTIGCKLWRFSLVSRFGINTKVKGSFYASYSLPFFINPVTFEPAYDFTDPNIINNSEMRQNLLANATDSIVYTTKKKMPDGSYEESDLQWKMPTGLTFAFDIFPEKLKISYTKIFGEVAMKLDKISREKIAIESGTSRLPLKDSFVVDFGVSVDHIVVLEANLFNSFLNLGVFNIDVRYRDQEDLIKNNIPKELTPVGNMVMIPVLNLGTTVGTKIKLLVEMDILPFPAFKSGFYYYF
ncbi:MAG: hypothetical protein N2053_04195 [Chitinispirillaceae bacterium]|nr:hypothetical protein [Chitinispirillaceae bacterium]